MALTVNSLIDDAIGEAYPFLAEYGVAKGHLLRHLSALEHDIVRTIATHNPHRLSAAGADVTIVPATNPTGYSLTDALKYVSFHYVNSNGLVHPHPIRIVRDDQYDNPPEHPSAVIRGSTFFPCDPAGTRWTASGSRGYYVGNGDKVVYRYIARPAALTTGTQTLASPDEARNFFVKSLVYQLLLGYPGVPPTRLADAESARTAEWANLHINLAKRSPVQSSYAGDSDMYGGS